MMAENFSFDVLSIDGEKETGHIVTNIRKALGESLKRRGLVVAVSGGIDSSVTAALSARAVGPNKVLCLQMPERHSADETEDLSALVADTFGIETVYENISGILESVGFYHRYGDAVRSVIPSYGDGWKSKIVIPNVMESEGYNIFSLVAQNPDGEIVKERLPLKAYLAIVAATNFKQRTRKMLEYYHADRLNYAVTGTPNRLEYDQGFFVKLGDGAADIKPIAHLYKSQVYQLAEYLGVPEKIRNRPPTTDTYSLAQGQDEFYFSLPYDKMDLCLYGKNNNVPPATVGEVIGLTGEQVERVYKDIETKRNTTKYLQMAPLLVGNVPEIRH
ncbi:MAG: NAD(+) synthase [Chitinivibrionales bacterium]|nr:NAD(+) synthase [Chitinivibrionales bacterium]